MSERAPYSRVYWTIVDDPKFVTIYDNDGHLAAWLRMLLIAEQAHPASGQIPSNARRASVKALEAAGLIDVTGGRFRIHGLDAERQRRSDAATSRAPSGTRPVPKRSPDGPLQNGDTKPERSPRRGLDETQLDETPRVPRESFRDPLLNEIRAAVVEHYGNGSDAPLFVRPPFRLSPAEQEREALRLEALALHERHLAGELEPAEYERLLADLGKPDDDLTRVGA